MLFIFRDGIHIQMHLTKILGYNIHNKMYR